MRPNVTSNVAVTMLYPNNIHNKYWKEESGSILMPRKMAGNAMRTMLMSIDAIKTPSVVFESTTHLYSGMNVASEADCL
jgi:hypothetical protein